MPLETFQSLTFESEHSQEFKTSQDFCFYLYNPQTSQSSRRVTQTEIHSQTDGFSQAHRQEQIYFHTPLQLQRGAPLSQVQNICITDVPRTEQEERVNRSQQRKCSADDKPTEQTEPAAAVCSCGATSRDRWEQSFQQDNAQVSTPKYPSTVYQPNFVQYRRWDIGDSPQACRDQEAFVGFKTANDHMGRVSGSDIETSITGCAGTKTHFHLCRCSASGGANKCLKQATTSNNRCQVSTGTVPIQSFTRSTTRSCRDGAQCHQFPKLSCSGLQLFPLHQSEDDHTGDTPSQAEEGQRLGSGLDLQQVSDDYHHNSEGSFIICALFKFLVLMCWIES